MRRISKAVSERLTALGIDNTTDKREVFQALALTPGGNPRKLLGAGAKTDKNLKKGAYTRVLYMAPHKLSGVNMCPWATKACAAACLGHSTGRLKMANNQRVLVAKALLWHLFPDYFLARLDAEMRAHIVDAKALGLRPAIRLNGSTDIRWERHLDFASYDCTFYDYTKAPRAKRDASNYHLTYSVSDKRGSVAEAKRWLADGGNVAIVVGAKDSAKLADAKRVALNVVRNGWHGFPAHSADETDARFLDEPGSVGVLYAKGAALRDASGFVQRH
jgi:hypothetical protein